MTDKHPILAREGWPFLIISGVLAVALTVYFGWLVASPAWLFFLFSLQFFRDPHRTPPEGENLVLSPADGRVVFVGPARDPFLDRPAIKISVFMNVFNVHSNRAPVSGVVQDRWYRPGSFVNAALDKASEENERNAIHLRTDSGQDVVSAQIAGLIARRILCYVDKGDRLERGQRYGFIRFGSRVDVYLPEDARPVITLGEKPRAGVSILAELAQQ
ncbi:MAG: phosphatidylserine decarboxylase family protein [Gammaproteobacteria bacterium]|nr:MAG: phosphatidylserine decarboxylase family protein [Gammaproteobacteria bacterium]RTZ60650.1 MAG: phosphatidylserine decarboxylase family protein [Gammaproteobacteria bacterium]